MSITPNGFEIMLINDIRQSIIDEIRISYPDLLLEPETVEGHLVDLVSNRVYQLYLLMQSLYNNTPQYAKGIVMDSFAILKGILRFNAQPAVVTETFVGVNGSSIPANTLISDASGFQYRTVEDLTMTETCSNKIQINFTSVPTSGTWTLVINGTSHTFNYDATLMTSHAKIASYTGNYEDGFMCVLTEQPSTVSVSRSGAFNAIPSFLLIERDDLFKGSVQAVATRSGLFTSPAWTVSLLPTTISGVEYLYNVLSSSEGRNTETDAELFERFVSEPGALGATIEGIKALLPRLVNDINDIDPVTKVLIKTHYGVGPSGAPNPLEVFISGGTGKGQIIADNLRLNLIAAGIEMLGDETYTVTDSDGFEHTSKFSRVTKKEIYVNMNISVNPATFPGEDAVKEALVTWGNALSVGQDVIRIPGVVGALINVPGILDVPLLELSDDDVTYSESNIDIDDYEESEWSASNITITIL
jgi:uncharacterized phage protein gp47/JayE